MPDLKLVHSGPGQAAAPSAFPSADLLEWFMSLRAHHTRVASQLAMADNVRDWPPECRRQVAKIAGIHRELDVEVGLLCLRLERVTRAQTARGGR